MNTKPFFSLLVVTSLYFTSCKEELKPQDDSTAVRADDAKNTSTPTPTTTPVQTQNQTSQTQSAAVATTAGMNPAHGQPGHQCGIPVGAPLNSAGNKTAAQPTVTQTIQPTMNPVANATKPVATAKGMNPPHGQPGHQCGIAVGAPLNSKPQVVAETQTTPTQNPTVQFTPAPTNNNATTEGTTSTAPALLTPPVATAPGMNPPHGQPGHVCGTAVGSPLPK